MSLLNQISIPPCVYGTLMLQGTKHAEMMAFESLWRHCENGEERQSKAKG